MFGMDLYTSLGGYAHKSDVFTKPHRWSVARVRLQRKSAENSAEKTPGYKKSTAPSQKHRKKAEDWIGAGCISYATP